MKEIFHARIRDLSHKGLGVVDHPDGRTFFVRGTWPGDEGDFEIDLNAVKYSEASLLELTRPSDDREEIPCPHRGSQPGKCGGCPWMMASYQSQLKYKVNRLQYALLKRRVVLPVNINEVIPSSEIFNYRNRVQLKTNGQKLGYVSEGSSVLAPIDSCIIMNNKLKDLFQDLKNSLPREDLKPNGNHHWCFVDLDDEMSLADVIVNKRRPFKQGNTSQNIKMRNWIISQFDDLPRHYPIIDLFCGSGNFTEVLVEMGFTNILAVEVQGAAIQNLKNRNFSNVRLLPLDMNAKGVWALIAKHQPHAKAILIDPPREGIEKRRGLFKYLDNLQTIIYISCEIDTYVRDIADFIFHGWAPEEITPLDLFPHTPHLEILSSFRKK